jgi:hypothetical protein
LAIIETNEYSMAGSQSADNSNLRIGVDDFKQRFEAGEPITVLDARNREPWDSSPVKIQGAMRWTGRVDPTWPKRQLTVVY